jgi:SNF family Na+-dependent transporter
VIYHNGGSAF